MGSDAGESPQLGFFGQLRDQHWAVKLILAFVVLMLGSPFIAMGAAMAYGAAGEAGVWILLGLVLLGAGWFVFTRPVPAGVSTGPATARPGISRYCESCGASFGTGVWTCPECGHPWRATGPDSIESLARYLNELTRDRQRDLIDAASYQRLKAEYERRLGVLRPAPSAPAPAATRVTPPPAAVPAREVRLPAPPRPPKAAGPRAAGPRPAPAGAGRAVIGWAAERQADILLYVGAFLLSVAAIIFVAYQGEELSGGIRFTVLTGYALGFLVFGLLLHRWERVKEAAPVFLALGAILVPIDFVALRTQLLSHDELANDVLWLIASSSCAALYFLLAFRGYGRFYFLPAIPATLIAWGALGSVINLPREWWGAWYLLAAAPAYVTAGALRGRWAPAAGLLWLAILTGAGSLAWTHLLAGLGGDHHAALPAAYGLATAGLAAGLRWRVDTPVLAALPPLAASTAASAWWAAFGLDYEWQTLFVALAGAGYLVVAHFQPEARARAWAAVGATFGVLAILGAHAASADPAAARGVLPATYAVAFAATGGAFGRWGWAAAALALPPLGGMTIATAAWASGEVGTGWYGAIAVIASFGYLALAFFDTPARTRGWQSAAAITAALGPPFAHAAIALDDDPQRWALPATYGLVLLGAAVSFLRWRWSWRLAPGVIPASAAATAAAASWARWDLQPEWYGSFAAAAALGYLVLAWFGPRERRTAWWGCGMVAGAIALSLAHATVAARPEAEPLSLPLTYAILAGGAGVAFAAWRYAWRVAPGVLPALAAMTAITAGWAQWEIQPAWYGAIATTATFGYIAWALFDAKAWARPWLAFAALAGGAGVVFTQAAQFADTAPAPAREALPVAYGQAFMGAAFAAAWWRWACREAIALLPPLAGAFGASLAWVTFDMRPGWLTVWAAAAAAGYLLPALLDRPNRGNWQLAAVFPALGALLIAHALVAADDPVRWQLPASYGVLLLAWTAFAARVCDASTLAPPFLASVLGATALWAAEAEPQWWPYPALGVAAAITAIAPWWQRNRIFGLAGWGYAVALATVASIAVLPVDSTHHAHGAAVQLAAAALLAVASLASRGAIFALFVADPTLRARRAEWSVLSQGAFAFLLGAGASLNGLLDFGGAGRAWTFAALSLAGWGLVGSRWRAPASLWTFAPAGLVGTAIASLIAAEAGESGYGTLTAVLGLATLGPLIGFAGARRWTLLGIANSFFLLAIWAGWRWQDLEMAYLPLAFAAVASVEWTALLSVRRYTREPSEPNLVIEYISWAPWLLSGAVSGILLSREQARLEPGDVLVTTGEWTLAATVLGLLSAAVTAEGIRLKRRWVWIGGSAGLLASLLMAIATRQPGNVQAYTAPIGISLILIALTFRRSAPLLGRHMHVHEAAMVLGALHLVLPPAEQSFEPGGGKFGLELLGIGLALLAVGLLFHGRWLVAAAILTLTATAVRMVTGGLFTTPYWLLLGIAGTALIGFGLVVLLERERWDRFRHGVVRWWRSVEGAPVEPLGGPRAPGGQHT